MTAFISKTNKIKIWEKDGESCVKLTDNFLILLWWLNDRVCVFLSRVWMDSNSGPLCHNCWRWKYALLRSFASPSPYQTHVGRFERKKFQHHPKYKPVFWRYHNPRSRQRKRLRVWKLQRRPFASPRHRYCSYQNSSNISSWSKFSHPDSANASFLISFHYCSRIPLDCNFENWVFEKKNRLLIKIVLVV